MPIVTKRGITEEYWGLMNEDRKLYWDLFTRSLAIVAAVFVTKTGVTGVDWVIGAFAAFTPLIIIRSQRSLRKYSEELRKRLLGSVIFLGSSGAAFLALMYFGLALLSSFFRVYTTDVASLRHQPDPLAGNIMLGIFLVACPIAVVKVWRDLRLREFIFDLPKRALKRLVLQRKYVANNFISFAHFELSVQVIGFVYASMCAGIVRIYLDLFLPK